MRDFLREYWLWIAVPIALVIALLLVLVFLGTDEGASPFVYNVTGY